MTTDSETACERPVVTTLNPIRILVSLAAGWLLAVSSVPAAAQQPKLLRSMGVKEGANYRFDSMAFSPDGKKLACSHYGSIRVYSPTSGKEISRTDVAPAAAGNLHLAYTPDGKSLISMGAGTITVWNAASNKKIREMDCGGGHGFALRPDGKGLAAIHHEKVEIWNPETGQKLTTLEPLFSPTVLAYTPDGKQLAIAGGTVLEFWDVEQRKELQSFPSLDLTVVSLAFRPDGKKLALGGQGQKLEHAVDVLDLASRETTRLFEERVGTNGGWISGLAYTPQGKTLFTFGGVDKLALRDAETGKVLASLEAPARPWDAGKAQTTLVLTAKGDILAACGDQVRVWSVRP